MNYQTFSILAAMLVSQTNAMHYPVTPCGSFQKALANPDAKAKKDAYNALKTVDVDGDCIHALLNLEDPEQATKFCQTYPRILELAAQNKVSIASVPPEVFAKLKPEVFNLFLKKDRENQCARLGENDFVYLNLALTSSKRAAEINAECFASIPRLDKHKVEVEHVKNLPDKAFFEIEGSLHENYLKGMTGNQLKHFQGAKWFDDQGDRCVDFHFKHIKPKVFENIPPACLQNWLANIKPDTPRKLTADHLKQISAKHFSNADYTAYANLRTVFEDQKNNKSAWEKANKDFVQLIADHEFWSHNLPAEAVHKELKVTPRSFANMNRAAQGAVLMRVENLPDDLFQHCSEAVIAGIRYTDPKNNKNDCEGFDCLSKLESHKNVAKIMEHIDEFIGYGKKFDQFTKKKSQANNLYLAGKYMSRTCYKNLDVDALQVENSGNDVHENMLQYVSIDIIKDIWLNKNGHKWRDLAEEYVEDKKKKRTWPGILRNPKVARLIKINTFHSLAKNGLTKAMDAFSSELLRAFQDFDKLTPEYIAAIGDQIYSAFTKSDASKIDYGKSSHAQIANASARVENIADHYATTLTSASVKLIPDAVFSIMNEGYFVAMTEDAYSGISKTQFGVAPPEKLTKVSAAQFSKMGDDVKKALSPEQITSIGSHGGPKSEPEMAMLQALGAVSSSFNEAQSKAYKARLAESSGAVGAAGTSLMVLAASLALVFPLL